MYTALLFDLDDTLIDFASSEESALNKIWHHFLAEHAAQEHCKQIFHTVNRALWSLVAQGKKRPEEVKLERFIHLIDHLKISLNASDLAHAYESWLAEQVIWFEGVQDSLKNLAKNYKMGIITNGLTTVQEKKYQLGGMHQWFDCFIISEKVGVSKPNKKIFQLAFDQLSISPHTTLMIGDSLESDYQGALNTGMDFCWINPKKDSLPQGSAAPKYIVNSVAELCLD
jgi:YjjG family noncanonical pyrimidine nucleotidase